MAKILIIEDDADIAAIERDYLELGGYEVSVCTDGAAGLAAALEQPFDLLLLDLMLPGMDGFTICRKVWEAKDIPILMVTALGKDVDKIRGLGYGADDYIEKPFSPSVLVARVKAHLAQYRRLKPAAAETTLLTAGPLAADTACHQITKNGVPVPLKNKEYELLLFLMRHPGGSVRDDLGPGIPGGQHHRGGAHDAAAGEDRGRSRRAPAAADRVGRGVQAGSLNSVSFLFIRCLTVSSIMETSKIEETVFYVS